MPVRHELITSTTTSQNNSTMNCLLTTVAAEFMRKEAAFGFYDSNSTFLFGFISYSLDCVESRDQCPRLYFRLLPTNPTWTKPNEESEERKKYHILIKCSVHRKILCWIRFCSFFLVFSIFDSLANHCRQVFPCFGFLLIFVFLRKHLDYVRRELFLEDAKTEVNWRILWRERLRLEGITPTCHITSSRNPNTHFTL